METAFKTADICRLTAFAKGEEAYKRAASKDSAIKALQRQLEVKKIPHALKDILNAPNLNLAKAIIEGADTPQMRSLPRNAFATKPINGKLPVGKKTNRNKALVRLRKAVGEPVRIDDLVAAVYGHGVYAPKFYDRIKKVLLGIEQVIAAGKLGVDKKGNPAAELKKIKEGKEIKYALIEDNPDTFFSGK